jgi:hypothetical protein
LINKMKKYLINFKSHTVYEGRRDYCNFNKPTHDLLSLPHQELHKF